MITDEAASVWADLDDASNILLRAPQRSQGEEGTCLQLLCPEPPADENVISVVFLASPDDCLEAWDRHDLATPADRTVVTVGQSGRGVDQSAYGDVRIEKIRDPSDLTRLGITLSDLVADRSVPDRQTVLCFNSVTTLLQYVETERAFRFFHTLRGRFDEWDVITHYHLDPAAHDEQTMGILDSLFDAVVDVTDDGGSEVRRQ